MPATLKISKENLIIETDFGYTYKIVKTETGLQLEESYDEKHALETEPVKKIVPEVLEENSEKGSIFDWDE